MSSIYNHLSRVSLKPNSQEEKSGDEGDGGGIRSWGIQLAILGAFLLSIGALAGAVILFQSFKTEKEARLAMEAQQTQLREKAHVLETKTQEYRSEISRMSEQMKVYASERDSIKEEFERNRIEVANLRKKVKELDDRNRKIEQVTQKVSLRESAPDTAGVESAVPDTAVAVPAAVAQSLNPVTPKAVSSPAPAKKDVLPAVGSESKAAAGKPAAAASSDSASVPKQARVLTVNRKFNFVVINIGMRDKIKMGDKLSIEKQGKRIADVQVEKLYDSFAAATILKETKDAPIQEGDFVRPS